MSVLLRVFALLAVLLFALPVLAQPGAKAYAPEDLRRLNVQDRIRVLEREYADQSNGRRLPDDQLEFYLDQIDSGWTFSRIQQDIAESLGGGRGWQPPRSGWQAREVICSSIDRRYNECRTPFGGPAVLSQQISDSACVEGQTWGQRRGLIWVDRGCRGRFREGHWGGAPGFNPGGGIACESREGKRKRCSLPFRGPVRIAEQLSNAPCIEGQTWSQSPGEVWVTRGCRAVFVETYGGGGLPGGRPHGGDYSVTCASDNERYRTCAWNRSYGRPFLIEQISRTACVEGRSWGYDGNQLWVDHGCRGRFGTR
ncbi:DUF3011 domain-containing protein [Pseudomarimonas salicorniae]|uniref:DUF3011 domain-containing protein n=1 Tax=Pseudomarimonas salicorniae TaxID=2933270 RepID=A0ABT0GLR9_9GAMM|nr:DUF3011 domain-containing protein [Lysobacter sp. CAU 1642]MCK7595489.1 DUF3011 domain-containing protein [Lysobacter sp. CAU 1642]